METQRYVNATEDDLLNLLKDKNSKNTDHSTNTSWKIFTDNLNAKSRIIDFENGSTIELNEILRKFYVEVRKLDGDNYKKKRLTTLRFRIQRRIHELRSNVDIINDGEFATSNEIFRAQCVLLKKKGLAKINHISHRYVKKMWRSFIIMEYLL